MSDPDIDNSLEHIASTIVTRGDRDVEGFSRFEDQDLAFNLAAMFGILFPQFKSQQLALSEANSRIATLHRKIGELVEAQPPEKTTP